MTFEEYWRLFAEELMYRTPGLFEEFWRLLAEELMYRAPVLSTDVEYPRIGSKFELVKDAARAAWENQRRDY